MKALNMRTKINGKFEDIKSKSGPLERN